MNSSPSRSKRQSGGEMEIANKELSRPTKGPKMTYALEVAQPGNCQHEHNNRQRLQHKMCKGNN